MELQDAVRKRRTIRRFKQDPIVREDIEKLINAARLAPCGGNMQRLRYIVIQDDKELVNKVFGTTAWAAFVQPKRNPVPGKTAPVAFLALTCDKKQNPVADAGAAIQNILLTACELGIGCCWIGAYKQEMADEIIGLPEDQKSVFLVALGYPDESPVQEDIDLAEPTKYYLDENDVLHVPKFRTEEITEWR